MNIVNITVMGCGNSTGVPAVGGYWGACDSQEPKNRRRRASLLLRTDETILVIDTGPDFREHSIIHTITRLDAVLYTHAHADHAHGIDDLRFFRFRQKALIPVYASAATLGELQKRFDYLFSGGNHEIYTPILEPHALEILHPYDIGGIRFVPISQDHGSCVSTGYRFGDFGYSVDMRTLDDTAIEALRGIRTWVVDCAAYHNPNNKVHASIAQIQALNERIGAEHVYLSSLSLEMDYQTLCHELPSGFFPAYDGLTLEAMC